MKIIPFILFVIVMTGTPGPGNLTMMAIGQAAGFRRAIPFLMGTTVGFLVLNTLVSLGMAEIVLRSIIVTNILKAIGICYICYLAFKLLKFSSKNTPTEKKFGSSPN